jgi:hypothetical protein
MAVGYLLFLQEQIRFDEGITINTATRLRSVSNSISIVTITGKLALT